MATKIQHPKTANQKEYNRQIDRIERFARKYRIDVRLPDAPKRVTQNRIDKVSDLRGRKILEISTVDVVDLIPYGIEGAKAQTMNAADFFDLIVGNDVSFSEGAKAFQSGTRYQQDVAQNKGVVHEQQAIDAFTENISQYRPFFRDTMIDWRDKMINRLGKKAFVRILEDFESEFGGIGKAEAYNLEKLAIWLNKFAERIDDPEIKQAALQEVEEMQSDQSFSEAFDDYKKYRRDYYKRRYQQKKKAQQGV